MPSDKRARQRAAREARLAAEARSKKRRTQLRNGGIVAAVAAIVVGIVVLTSGNSTPKKKNALTVKTTTTTTAPGGSTTTTAAGGSTTSTSRVTTTTAATAASNAKAQQAANAIAANAGCPASTSARVNTQKYSAAPTMTIDPNKLYAATVVTTAGTFTMALNAKTAPKTVNNFVFLADKGYYHCVTFHRVIPGFMDQTGDPTGTGSGGPGYTIADENPAKVAAGAAQYPIGSVAMANTGQPNSAGSQFFIVTGPTGESLPNTYALFGRVTSGLDVANTINSQGSAQGVPPNVIHRIISVTIHESAGL